MSFSAKNVINGTWGEVWIDGEKISECTALNAKITLSKTDVNIAGKLAKSSKVTGWEGKGQLKMLKINSRMILKTINNIKNGKETICTIVSKLADPDALGAERIVLKNVAIDDLTLMDWEVKKNGEITVPFTFDDYDMLDTIKPQ